MGKMCIQSIRLVRGCKMIAACFVKRLELRRAFCPAYGRKLKRPPIPGKQSLSAESRCFTFAA